MFNNMNKLFSCMAIFPLNTDNWGKKQGKIKHNFSCVP